jgi:hypothetical protein
MQTPGGRYALDWQQRQLDRIVADIFGFHALQLGLRDLAGLRHNRMPHRWFARDVVDDPEQPPGAAGPAALVCEFTDLPIASQSLDLVVLPHTLEVASDPYACLREADRVLVATKRGRAMRLVGKAWQPSAAKAGVGRPVAHRRAAHSRREPGGSA